MSSVWCWPGSWPGLFGVLIGIPALRLTGDYLAILTLGFGEIIRITLNNIDDVLGFKLFYGAKGLKNIPKYSNFAMCSSAWSSPALPSTP